MIYGGKFAVHVDAKFYILLCKVKETSLANVKAKLHLEIELVLESDK